MGNQGVLGMTKHNIEKDDEFCQDINIEGITLMSRYGRQYEIDQMITFVALLSSRISLEQTQIKEIFIDSKSSMTIFFFHDGQDSTNDCLQDFLPPPVCMAIYGSAKEALNQFEWNGVVEHGFDFLKEDPFI
jgi:hypothetical protein